MWKWIILLPTAMMVVAYFDMPYGYYQFLRLVITVIAVWCLLKIYDGSLNIATFALLAIAIIYNPIAVIHMTREAHQYVNLCTALIFGAVGWRCKEKLS
jgi:hypothetical protein